MVAFARAYVQLEPDMRTFPGKAREGVAKAGLDKEGAKHGRAFGSKFGLAAKAALAGIGALVAIKGVEFFADIIKQGEEAARTSRIVAAAIKSTGGAAHVSSKQIDDLTRKIGDQAGVDDDVIKAGSAMLLTFRNIRNEQGKGNDIFSQANKTLVDMTAALHGGDVSAESLRKQSIQLGKALNDPVKGISALQRVGVTFTDQQKKQITTLVESGHRLEAQKIILRELGKEFGGAAAASASPMQKLKARFDNFKESLGTSLLPLINTFVSLLSKYLMPALTSFGDWFATKGVPALKRFGTAALPQVVELIKTFATGIGTIVKVALSLPGPLKIAGVAIIALGVAMRLAAAANPWVLLGVAIILVVGLIVRNWGKIKQLTSAVWQSILADVSIVWNWIKTHWPLLLTIIAGPIGAAAALIITHWHTITHGASVLVGAITGFFAGMFRTVRQAFAVFVGLILGFFGNILHGAATAFGWIPGLGDKLRTAASRFDTFARNVTNSIAGIQGKTVHVGVAFAAAQSGHQGPSLAFPAGAKGLFVRDGTTATADDVLARVSKGELVVPTKMVKAGAVDHLRGSIPGFARGGQVGQGVSVRPDLPAQSVINAAVGKAVVAMAKKWMVAFGTGGNQGIVRDAMRWIGRIPYVWGGTAVPGGADCSGFVQAIYRRHGIIAPRTSEAQGAWVRRSPPVPGGLAFYNSPAGGPPPGHVAIVGNRGMVISQGGGLGPQYVPLRSMALMWTGIPPALSGAPGASAFTKFARGGAITEPIIGLGRSGRGYSFGEGGKREQVSSQADMQTVAGLLRELIGAVHTNARTTAAGVADALDGASQSAAYAARYSVG